MREGFWQENRELCYMVNSWMDAPSRDMGKAHRQVRHDPDLTPVEACMIYGDYVETKAYGVYRLLETEKNKLIARMVLQHLKLDGLITPQQEKAWTWERMWKNIEIRVRIRIEELRLPYEKVLEEEPEKFWGALWLEGLPEEERIKEIIIAYLKEKKEKLREMIRKGELVRVNGKLMTKETALRREKERKAVEIPLISSLITGLLGFLIGYSLSGDGLLAFLFGFIGWFMGFISVGLIIYFTMLQP